jgi:hypothetical protein
MESEGENGCISQHSNSKMTDGLGSVEDLDGLLLEIVPSRDSLGSPRGHVLEPQIVHRVKVEL